MREDRVSAPPQWHRKPCGLLLFILAIATPLTFAHAATWHVETWAPPGGDGSASAPFATIAMAMDLAQPGDVVRLGPGLFEESTFLDVDGKDRQAVLVLEPGVRVIGAGAESTFLTPPSSEPPTFGISAGNTVGPDAVVEDLAIVGACSHGVNLRGASPTLRRLNIQTDVVGESSLAFDARDGSFPAVEDCLIDGGHSSLFVELDSGGRYTNCEIGARTNETLVITRSDPELLDCRIAGAGRDTIVLSQDSSPVLQGCTIGEGGRWTVRVTGYSAQSTVDLTGNRWFTQDPVGLSAAILDAQDDPGLGGTVVFEPFDESVGASPKSFGGLKATIFKRHGQ